MNSEATPTDNSFAASSTSHHSNFTPSKTSAKGPKPPKPPEKPLMPYMRYSREIWESVKAANPELKLSEIGREIGKMWRELSPNDKQRYVEGYETDKVKYLDAFKIYQSSPAYQQYLIVKEKFDSAEEKERAHVTPHVAVVKGKPMQKPEPRLALPTCNTEEMMADDLDYFHQRQLAAARYQRNHRLLQEVFNDACVPDPRQVITTPRLHSMKRQVETLTMHQKKIDTEVNQLIETFEAKKRRLEDGSREFHLSLEKCNKPALTSTAYDSMVEAAEKHLLDKYKAYLAFKESQPQEQQQSSRTNGGTSSPTATISSASDTTSTNGTSDQQLTAPSSDGHSENGKSEPELRNGDSETTAVNGNSVQDTPAIANGQKEVATNGGDNHEEAIGDQSSETVDIQKSDAINGESGKVEAPVVNGTKIASVVNGDGKLEENGIAANGIEHMETQ